MTFPSLEKRAEVLSILRDATVLEKEKGGGNHEVDDLSAIYLALVADINGQLPPWITVDWGPRAQWAKRTINEARPEFFKRATEDDLTFGWLSPHSVQPVMTGGWYRLTDGGYGRFEWQTSPMGNSAPALIDYAEMIPDEDIDLNAGPGEPGEDDRENDDGGKAPPDDAPTGKDEITARLRALLDEMSVPDATGSTKASGRLTQAEVAARLDAIVSNDPIQAATELGVQYGLRLMANFLITMSDAEDYLSEEDMDAVVEKFCDDGSSRLFAMGLIESLAPIRTLPPVLFKPLVAVIMMREGKRMIRAMTEHHPILVAAFAKVKADEESADAIAEHGGNGASATRNPADE